MKFYYRLREYDPIMAWCYDHFGAVGGDWNAGSDFDMMCGRLRYFITIKDPNDALLFALAWPCELADETEGKS